MVTFCRRSDDIDDHTPSPRLVDSADAALDTIYLAAHAPARAEIIVLLLDGDYVGHTVMVIDGTTSPDAVIERSSS